jgi:hypothetical protein
VAVRSGPGTEAGVADRISTAARARRRTLLTERFSDLGEMDVLDLGGTPGWWRQAPVRPRSLTLINLRGVAPPEPWMTLVRGDACEPPARISQRRFDLVFSNSLIEHVGGHVRRQQLADVIHAASPHHWVQTPYRYFPVEPHWRFPGFQFLPVGVRASLSARWRHGHVAPAGDDERRAVEDVLGVELLSITELQHYFPGSEIVRERFAGLTKGLIAVR